jgi:hypothetical protein
MNRFWGLALLLSLFVTACAAPRMAGLSARPGGPSLYPANFRAQHHVTITAGGRQVTFTGYLLVQQSTWRALAFSEFGVSLFDVTASPGKGIRVVKSIGMPSSYLTGPAADIIEILFLPPQAGDQVLPGGRLQVIRRGTVYDITYSDYAAFPGSEQKIPKHILLENKKTGFRLQADLLKFEPMDIPEKYFE